MPLFALPPKRDQLFVFNRHNEARLLQLPSGTIIGEFQGHTGPILAATFSPDGTKLVTTSSDQTIRIWTVSPKGYDASVLPEILQSNKGAVLAVAFSPDGTQLLVGTEQGYALVWDLTKAISTEPMYTLHDHEGPVRHVVYSPIRAYAQDEMYFVTGGDDGKVNIYQKSGILQGTTTHTQPITSVQVSRRGTTLVSFISQDSSGKTASSRCGSSEEKGCTFQGFLQENSPLSHIDAPSFTDLGAFYGIDAHQSLKLYYIESGYEQSYALPGISNTTSYTFSPSRKYLAQLDSQGTLHIYGAITENAVEILQGIKLPIELLSAAGVKDPQYMGFFGPKEDRLLMIDKEDHLQIWSVELPQFSFPHPVSLIDRPAAPFSFSSSGTSFLNRANQNTWDLNIWNQQSSLLWNIQRTLSCPSSESCKAYGFGPTNDSLFFTTTGTNVYGWDAQGNPQWASLPIVDKNKGSIQSSQFSTDGNLIFGKYQYNAGATCQAYLLNAQDGKVQADFSIGGASYCALIPQILVYGRDLVAYISEQAATQCTLQLAHIDSAGRLVNDKSWKAPDCDPKNYNVIKSLQFSPNGQQCLVQTAKYSYLIDPKTLRTVATWTRSGSNAIFSPDGTLLAETTAYPTNGLFIWETNTHQLRVFQPYPNIDQSWLRLQFIRGANKLAVSDGASLSFPAPSIDLYDLSQLPATTSLHLQTQFFLP